MKNILLFIILLTAVAAKAQVTADAGADKDICIMDTLKITGKGLSPNDAGSYEWTEIPGSTLRSSTADLKIHITSMTSRHFVLKVTKIDNGNTYTDVDTVDVFPQALPTFQFSGDNFFCYPEGPYNLTGNQFALALPGNQNVKYSQKKSNSWISKDGSGNYIYEFNKHILESNIMQTAFRDTICYEYTDQNGCYNTECKKISILGSPQVRVVNGTYCQDNGLINLDPLAIIPFSKVGGIQSWRCIAVPAGSGVNKDDVVSITNGKFYLDPGLKGEREKGGEYIVEYNFTNATTGCGRYDTAIVTVLVQPEFTIDPIPGQCINYPYLALDSFVHLKGKSYGHIWGQWKCVEYGGSRDLSINSVKNAINNSVKSQKYFDPKTDQSGGQYLLKFTDLSTGCKYEDSVSINVNGLPQINLFTPDTLCSDANPKQLISNYSSNDTNGRWFGYFVDSSMFNPKAAFAAGKVINKVYYIYRNPLTLCSDTDSTEIVVTTAPEFDFELSNPDGDSLANISITNSNFNASQYTVEWNINGNIYTQKTLTGVNIGDSSTVDIICTMTAINGCSKVVKKTLAHTTSLKKAGHVLQHISVFPNPSSGRLYIVSGGTFNLSVTDVTGRVILTAVNTEFIDLPKGCYFLRFESEGQSTVRKVIVQ